MKEASPKVKALVAQVAKQIHEGIERNRDDCKLFLKMDNAFVVGWDVGVNDAGAVIVRKAQ